MRSGLNHLGLNRLRAPWGFAAWGAVLGLVAATVLFAPATWLADAVSSASNGRVQLAEPSGTIWKGSARVLLSAGEKGKDKSALPTRLNWQIDLAVSGFNLSLQTDCCLQKPWNWHVSAGFEGIKASADDLASNWPLELLSGLGTPWNTVQAKGQLAVNPQKLVLGWQGGNLAVSGQLQMDALNVSSSLSTLKPMGSYRILVSGSDSPTLHLQTLNGALILSGDGRWVAGQIHFKGTASAQAQHELALSNLLNIIGHRDGDHSVIQLG